MPAVLGIDAAWTLKEPSGVALVAKFGTWWRLVAAAPSYQQFHFRAAEGATLDGRPIGSRPNASELLASASSLCQSPIDVVAIDMPLSHKPIVGRRISDTAVSKAFGARKCATHSPSATRPGPISDELTEGFARAGYPLQTTSISPPGLIEVYPHPALVVLADAPERLPYKVSRARSYWRDSTPSERRVNLLRDWEKIVRLLESEILGVVDALRLPATDAPIFELKAFEDMLDAIICAWTATRVLEGHAQPYGDRVSAIWVPSG